jgi:hypothetical protein
MRNLPNFRVEISGLTGEVFVSDNDKGRYMCIFVKTPETDFASIYEAYGFMVWTTVATSTQTEYFPIKLQDHTNLTEAVMSEIWAQVSNQIDLT